MKKTKILLMSLLSYGLPVGIFAGYLYAKEYGLIEGIKFGFLFGVPQGLLASLLVFAFYSNPVQRFIQHLKKLSSPCRSFEINGNLDLVYEKCCTALIHIGANKITKDCNKKYVKGQKGMSFFTCGEDLQIILQERELNLIVVTISSRPALEFNIIDWGQNKRNVNWLVKRVNDCRNE